MKCSVPALRKKLNMDSLGQTDSGNLISGRLFYSLDYKTARRAAFVDFREQYGVKRSKI